jgi:hypothetical protein
VKITPGVHAAHSCFQRCHPQSQIGSGLGHCLGHHAAMYLRTHILRLTTTQGRHLNDGIVELWSVRARWVDDVGSRKGHGAGQRAGSPAVQACMAWSQPWSTGCASCARRCECWKYAGARFAMQTTVHAPSGSAPQSASTMPVSSRTSRTAQSTIFSPAKAGRGCIVIHNIQPSMRMQTSVWSVTGSRRTQCQAAARK